MPSLFKSTSGKQEILELYDKKLEELNINYTTSPQMPDLTKPKTENKKCPIIKPN